MNLLPLLVAADGASDLPGVAPALLLLALALTIALCCRFIRIPYTVALVLVGAVLGLSQHAAEVLDVPSDALTPDLIFLILLPPLLFEGCVNINLDQFRARARLILLLAFGGTLLTAGIVGFAAYRLIGDALGLASEQRLLVGLLVGVIVTPTDPVSVIALFRELGVGRDLAVVVEGESVLNDGVGLVVFLILLDLLAGGEVTATGAAGMFLWEVGGGALVGIVLGYFTYRLLARLDDHLIEVSLSLLLAYGSYIVADHLHASGVLSTVCAGLVIGNYGKTLGMSPTTRLTLGSFWEVLAFVANSVLFLVVGLKLNSGDMLDYWRPIVGLFIIGLGARVLAVWGCALLAGRQRPPTAWLTVIWWSGVRGSIPVAMALALVGGTAGLGGPQLEPVLAVAFGVVLLSLVVQGLSMRSMLNSLGIASKAAGQERLEHALAAKMALNAGLSELAAMRSHRELSEEVHDALAATLREQEERLRGTVAEMLDTHAELRQAEQSRAARRVLHAQRAAVDEAVHRGIISDAVHHALVRDIDTRLEGDLGLAFTPDDQE